MRLLSTRDHLGPGPTPSWSPGTPRPPPRRLPLLSISLSVPFIPPPDLKLPLKGYREHFLWAPVARPLGHIHGRVEDGLSLGDPGGPINSQGRDIATLCDSTNLQFSRRRLGLNGPRGMFGTERGGHCAENL